MTQFDFPEKNSKYWRKLSGWKE